MSVPVRLGDDNAKLSLADRVTTLCYPWQVENRLLDFRGEQQQACDLRDAGTSEPQYPSGISVVGDLATADHRVDPVRQRQHPRNAGKPARERDRGPL